MDLMNKLVVDGVILAYRIDGTRGGPPVVLLHGVTGSHRTYDEVVHDLDPAFEIHRLDFRGHGESSRAPGTYDIDHLVADVVTYLRTVVGRPAFLAGHSLGGVVTHCVAQRYPDLVVAAFEEDPPLFFCDHSLFEQSPFAFVFPMLAEATRAMQSDCLPTEAAFRAVANTPTARGGIASEVMTDIAIAGRADEMLRVDVTVFDGVIDGTMLQGYNPLDPVTVPLTILAADPALGAALAPEHVTALSAAHPSASLIEIDRATHLIHTETPTYTTYLAHLRNAIATAFADADGQPLERRR